MAKKKEKSSGEIRLEKMKERINKIKKEQKLKEDLEKKEKELRELRKKENIKKNNTPLLNILKTSGLSISPLNSNFSKKKKMKKGTYTQTRRNEATVFSEKPKSLTGVRNPINDTEKMWVESWWENRKTLDPNFDIDNWFKSSVHMDLKDRNKQIEDFWTGRANQNTDDFWTGPTMWAREKMI